MSNVRARLRDILDSIVRPSERMTSLVASQLEADDDLVGVVVITPGSRPGTDFSILGWLTTLGLRERRRWYAIAVTQQGFKMWLLDRRDRPAELVLSGGLDRVGVLGRSAGDYFVEVAGLRYWLMGAWVKHAKRMWSEGDLRDGRRLP